MRPASFLTRITILTVTATLAAAGCAQMQPGAGTTAASAQASGAPGQSGLRELDDTKVVGAAGERIGEIDEALMDASGRVVAVSVKVDGTKKQVIFRLDQLRFEGGRFVTTMTKAQAETLPAWDDRD